MAGTLENDRSSVCICYIFRQSKYLVYFHKIKNNWGNSNEWVFGGMECMYIKTNWRARCSIKVGVNNTVLI